MTNTYAISKDNLINFNSLRLKPGTIIGIKHNIYIIDFETRSRANLKDTGAWIYSKHPSTEVMCLAIKRNDQPTQLLTEFDLQQHWSKTPILEQLKQDLDENIALVEAHNVFFEKSIWRNVLEKKHDYFGIRSEYFRCSAALAAYYALPRALGKCGDALELDTVKDDEGRRIMLQLSKPRVNGEFYKREAQ